jgi:group I intron endonuclease
MFYLYKITNNINGKIYIGAANDLKERWRKHKSIAHSDGKTIKKFAIHFAIIKYGFENFDFQEIDTANTWEEAMNKEIEFIKKFKQEGYVVYNMTDGGEGVQGHKWTEEQKRVKSESMKGSKHWMFGKKMPWITGDKNPNYGKSPPEHITQAFVTLHTKITKEQVQEIKDLYSTNKYTQTELAKTFHISTTQVHRIIHNKRWNGKNNFDTPITKHNITKEQVIEMRALYFRGEYTQKELGARYNLSSAQISLILNNKRWKNI